MNKQVYPGFGGASLSGEGGGYGFGPISEQESEILLKGSWEQGISLYDTAPIYGFGLSEERMGRYLHKDAVILSKGGVTWHDSRRVNMTNEPEVIEKMFFETLARLRREQISIYLIHWPDARVDIRKPYEVLKKFQDQGLVKWIGLSNPDHQDILKAQEIASVDVLQFEASYLNYKAVMDLKNNPDVSNVNEGAFLTGWGTFAKGILTGRVTHGRKYEKTDARSWAPWWKKSDLLGQMTKAEKFLELSKVMETTPAALALLYSTEILKIHAPLVGFKSVSDLEVIREWENLRNKKNVDWVHVF